MPNVPSEYNISRKPLGFREIEGRRRRYPFCLAQQHLSTRFYTRTSNELDQFIESQNLVKFRDVVNDESVKSWSDIDLSTYEKVGAVSATAVIFQSGNAYLIL